jgi:hypothetical protein
MASNGSILCKRVAFCDWVGPSGSASAVVAQKAKELALRTISFTDFTNTEVLEVQRRMVTTAW